MAHPSAGHQHPNRRPGAGIWVLVIVAAVVVGLVVTGGLLLLGRQGSTPAAEGAGKKGGSASATATVTSAEQVSGVVVRQYAAGQPHVATSVDYAESPPVGGSHDPEWADCTGSVYEVSIRPENAVHSLEHGAVWITYDPGTISDEDLSTLEDIVTGNSGLMLSPYPGLPSVVSLQSWNHQLFLDSASDARVGQYVEFFTYGVAEDGTALYPEVGASCENPGFLQDPLVAGQDSRASGSESTDAPTTQD